MKFFIFTCVLLLFFYFIPQALAVGAGTSNDCPAGSVCLDNPLNVDTPQKLIGQIIKGGLGLIGSLALAMFVYGGFTWMLSAGNSTQIEKGKSILIWATIGLVFIFSSYAVLQFIFQDVLGV